MKDSQRWDLIHLKVDIFSFCLSYTMMTADTKMSFPLLYSLADIGGRSGRVQ
jgi:hypothetical protein